MVQLYMQMVQSKISNAALLYVDDTDRLHKTSTSNISEQKIVQFTQDATYYWAQLFHATGGNL